MNVHGSGGRTAGIAAQCEVASIGAAGSGRAAGGTAGQPARRAHIRWRSIVGIDATHAVEELVANRFAGDRGAGGENFLHSAGVSSGALLRGEPIRTATAGP